MTMTWSRLSTLGLSVGLLGACGSIQEVAIDAQPGGQPTFRADVDRGIYDVVRDVRLNYRIGTASPVDVPEAEIGGGGGGRYRTYDYTAPEIAPGGALITSIWTVEFTQGDKTRSTQIVLAPHDLVIDDVEFVDDQGNPLEPLPTGGFAFQSNEPVRARVTISNAGGAVDTVELRADVVSSSPEVQGTPPATADLPDGLGAGGTALVELSPFTFVVQNFASGTIIVGFENNEGDANPANDEENVGFVVQP